MATTVVNTPPTNNQSDNNGIGLVIGIVLLIITGALFFYYGLPYIKQMTNQGVQINVPKDINVNVQQTN